MTLLQPSARRFFSISGLCLPELNYMLPPEQTFRDISGMIEQKSCFVLRDLSRNGTSTLLRSLAARLRAEGRFAALTTSCEVGQSLQPDLEGSIDAILYVLDREAGLQLSEELRPPAPNKDEPATSRFFELLRRWSLSCPKPIVLLLDEIDALLGDTRENFLQQLKSGLPDRPDAFPHSVVLVGLRDDRSYRAMADSANKLETLTLRNFTTAEVVELYGQHTTDTGQIFEPAALARAFELTQGQPWLVNALARQCVEVLVSDPAQPITRETVDAAKELLIQRRDTHLDSLIDRLREPRVRRVIAAILAGELLPLDLLDDDVAFVTDLGLVRAGAQGLEIANPIYAEIVPRALTQNLEASLSLPSPSYVTAAGRLDFAKLLKDFRSFWLASAEAFLQRAPYSEAAAQLVFMAFLHKVVNGGGAIERELAVGRGRVNLCIRWPYWEAGGRKIQSQAIELKVWRDGAANPAAAGVEQLAGYLERLGLREGTLLIFDGRSTALPIPDRQQTEVREHRDLAIEICWL